MHGSNHEGRVFSGIRSLVLRALTSVKDLVVGWASDVYASGCVALLCLLVWRLFMCLSMQHD